jgi:hypothetical protein
MRTISEGYRPPALEASLKSDCWEIRKLEYRILGEEADGSIDRHPARLREFKATASIANHGRVDRSDPPSRSIYLGVDKRSHRSRIGQLCL